LVLALGVLQSKYGSSKMKIKPGPY